MESSSEDDGHSSDSARDAANARRRKRTRDEAIYGTFLDDMTGGEDDDGGARRGGVGASSARDYSAPIGFTRAASTAGVGGGGLGFVRGKDSTAEATEATASGRSAGGGLGYAGFSKGSTMMGGDTMSVGLGARGAVSSSEDEDKRRVEDEDDDEDEDLLPSTFGQRYAMYRGYMRLTAVGIDATERLTYDSCFLHLPLYRLVAGAAQRAKMAEEERKQAKAKRAAEEKAARARNRENTEAFAGTSSRRGGGSGVKSKANDVGSFEKHTKGIGMKLLEKMGYKKGEGLGKGASGITRALETTLRPKNMGMGFNNFKENVNDPTSTRAKDESGEEASEDDMDVDEATRARDIAKKAQEQTMWKKRNDLRRQKREYKTAEELLAEEQENAQDAKSVKLATEKLNIIDMRGAHAQVVNANELHKSRVISADDDDLMLPELQHNLKLIVDLAENDITKLDGKIRSEKDTLEILRREKMRLSKQATAHADLAERTKSALKVVEECDGLSKSVKNSEDFSALTSAWVNVVKQYPEEFFSHRLNRLALAHAAPYVRNLFKDWDPSKQPMHGVEEIRPWRKLLSPERIPDKYKGVFEDDSFDTLLREPLLKRLRPIITSQWDPTRASDILDFIEAWSDVMSEALLRELTHALILPRLQRRVAEWQPTQERVALHSWFHPWLPLLHKNLKDLYPSIRQKFTMALVEWEASDSSALALLKPWARVFEPKDWSSLMRRCITPKLEDALAMLQINPSNQVLEPLKCVLKWEPMLGSSAFITLLEQHFFRKWHTALHAWLSTGSANFDEVTQWYLGWKTVFPEELLAHERMRVQLNVALDMMNQAASGDGVVMPNIAAAQPNADRVTDERKPHPMDEPQFTLKEMIEQFANSHDMEFVPNPSGRRHDGLAVYTFGGVNVVVDAAREAIRAYVDGEWIPISLDQLLERAQALTK